MRTYKRISKPRAHAWRRPARRCATSTAAGSDSSSTSHRVIMGYESARALAWEYANHPGQLSTDLKPRLDEGWKVTRAEYDAVREAARQLRPRARRGACATSTFC